MKKRALAVMLTFTLAAGSLAGCARNTSGFDEKGDSSKNEDMQVADAGEVQTAGSEMPSSTGRVEFWNDKLSGTE